MSSLNQSSLPYYYETEQDPVTLPNGIVRQQSWGYVVEPHSEISIDGKHYPFIFERLREMASYRFEDYLLVFGYVHEWQYLMEDGVTYLESVYGYRFYHDGLVRKDGKRHLQPEIAVILGYTPEYNKVPAYIDIAQFDDIKSLITRAEEQSQSTGPSNAWFALPIDVPRTAPQDVYQTLRQMREEIGIRATRGRGRMLQEMMEKTGVYVGESGWRLTEPELTRRMSHKSLQQESTAGGAS